MSSITNIVIIGGGASGTIAAIHLLHEFKGRFKINLLEKRQSAVFRGAAYSSRLEFELLNVPAGKMSVFSDLPNDFYDWVKANRDNLSASPITADSFVSRRWFGDYLTERLEEAKAGAPNASFEVVVSEATDIVLGKKAIRYNVKLSDGGFLEADYLIFATGNEPPADVLNNLEKALLGDKYMSDPWASNPLENLSANDDVLVIGSGLSMVDYALSLYKRNHQGKIYSFSKHGYLPLPQPVKKDGEVDFNLDDTHILSILNKLRTTIADSKKRGLEWQQIINAIRDKTPVIWQRLNPQSKRIFLKRLKHFWEVHRHRMPFESVQLIDEMRSKGKLELLAGRQKGITISNRKYNFQFTTKAEGLLKSIKVDYVINCTGPKGNYSEGSNLLIKNLLTKGWMKQDELRLGIVTSYNGEIITAHEATLPNAYAIGPLRKATEWESTAIREIKIQAEQIALDIALSYSEPELLTRLCKSEL